MNIYWQAALFFGMSAYSDVIFGERNRSRTRNKGHENNLWYFGSFGFFLLSSICMLLFVKRIVQSAKGYLRLHSYWLITFMLYIQHLFRSNSRMFLFFFFISMCYFCPLQNFFNILVFICKYSKKLRNFSVSSQSTILLVGLHLLFYNLLLATFFVFSLCDVSIVTS